MNELEISTQKLVYGAVTAGAILEEGLLLGRDPALDLLVASTVYTICGVPINPIVDTINKSLDRLCHKLLE